MRTILSIIAVMMFFSCSTIKYKGVHSSNKKFNQDLDYCLKEACEESNKGVFDNITIISSALAYGGGGGSGGGSGTSIKRISYKILNLCLEERGYVKDENGIFEISSLYCS